MPMKLGTKVRYRPYLVPAQIVDCSVKHDPPRYSIRCVNGIYVHGVKEADLEVVGGETGADATAGDDGGRVSKRA
jgi:hypothetical protein